MTQQFIRFVVWAGLALVYLMAVLWAAGALYFDLPFPSLRSLGAILWLGGAIILPILWRKRRRGFLIVIVGFAAILAWWLTIQPRNDRDWKPEVAVLAHADIDGNRVTIHDIRNFEYRTETDFTPHYNTRSYDLDQLKGIDLFVNYWGSDLIAHPIISFDFGNNNHIAFSIETRPEKGEGYSTMGGLYRRFELIYIPGDERDLVRVRTNFRKGEDVYLFKINSTPERERARFLEYITQLNQLYAKPRWYNVLTTNCTTSIRSQRTASDRAPWDWRILANGKADEMLYERGTLDRSISFPELKRRAHINERRPPTMRRISPTRSGLEPPDINMSIFVIRGFGVSGSNCRTTAHSLGVRVIKPLNARGFPDRDPPPFESEDSEVLRSESVN